MLGEIISTARSIVQDRDLVGVTLKVAEETGELAQAVLKNQSYEEVIKEVADILIVTSDAGYQAALYAGKDSTEYETDLMIAIGEKLNKWVQVYGK